VLAVVLAHVLHELLHHLVVERRHRSVQHFEDVEHVQQLGNVAAGDVLHPIVLEQVVDPEQHPLRLQVKNELANVRAQTLNFAMLLFIQAPDSDVDPLPGFRNTFPPLPMKKSFMSGYLLSKYSAPSMES
jgi:hypothetical protein